MLVSFSRGPVVRIKGLYRPVIDLAVERLPGFRQRGIESAPDHASRHEKTNKAIILGQTAVGAVIAPRGRWDHGKAWWCRPPGDVSAAAGPFAADGRR